MSLTITNRPRKGFYAEAAGDYLPHTIGDWVAVENRDLPWNTIGSALDHSKGKGTKVADLMTAEAVLAATGMDVTVDKTPVVDPRTGEQIPRMFTTSVTNPDDSIDYFAAVSDKYEVVQPREALAFFDNVLGIVEGAHYSAAWYMREKSMMGVTIELPTEIVVDPGGAEDRVVTHLLGINSFDGATGLVGALSATRLWCMNQVVPILRNSKRKFCLRHTRNVRNRIDDARRMVGVVMDYAAELDAMANKLFAVNMSDAQFQRFIARVPGFELKGDETDLVKGRILERRTEAIQAWEAPHNANVRGTAWGALNVVTEYIEWGRTVRGSNRTGADPDRQRAIGTMVHPTVTATVDRALALLDRR